jgi:hypothetical protein
MLDPKLAIRVPHKESQMIHLTQQLSGSALSESADLLAAPLSPDGHVTSVTSVTRHTDCMIHYGLCIG